jgi:hypothetical protein
MMNFKKFIALFPRVFFTKSRKTGTGKNAFCVITFAPIEVQTHSASQNDRLNLSFVKDVCVDGKKVARNGHKTAI